MRLRSAHRRAGGLASATAVTAVVAAIAAAGVAPADARPPIAEDFVEGSGVPPDAPADRFTFSARSGIFGENATGTMTYFLANENATIKADVRCLRVVGNRAVVTGTVTESPLAPPGTGGLGTIVHFNVADGGKRGVDLFADWWGGVEDYCVEPEVFPEPSVVASGSILVDDCTALSRNGKRCAKRRSQNQE
jgi:hypothetical protein